MQENIRNLDKSINLIYHYPTELIHYIFELAAEQNEAGFKTATVISHVCQRWRDISLDIPILWIYARISVRKDHHSMNEFLDRVQSRIKGLPPIVSIDDIEDTSSHRLEYVTLGRFMHIQRLVFQVRNAQGILALLRLVSRLDPNSSKNIDLIFGGNSGAGDLDYTCWDLDDIIDQFSPLRLFIYNPPTFFLAWNSKWHQIVHLIFQKVDKLDIVVTLGYFVGLEDVEIIETNLIVSNSNSNLTLDRLQRFKLWKVSNMADTLEKISCPELTTLEVDIPIDTSGIPLFLSRHPIANVVLKDILP